MPNYSPSIILFQQSRFFHYKSRSQYNIFTTFNTVLPCSGLLISLIHVFTMFQLPLPSRYIAAALAPASLRLAGIARTTHDRTTIASQIHPLNHPRVQSTSPLPHRIQLKHNVETSLQPLLSTAAPSSAPCSLASQIQQPMRILYRELLPLRRRQANVQ
jgi:hypothetical protein